MVSLTSRNSLSKVRNEEVQVNNKKKRNDFSFFLVLYMEARGGCSDGLNKKMKLHLEKEICRTSIYVQLASK